VAPTTVYLHVGMHKTGTTYLQNLLSRNRDALLERRLQYAGGREGVSQVLAVADLQGKRPRGHEDARVAGTWEALVAEIESSPAETALISHEGLGFCTLRQVRNAVASFSGEVHAVVTARDLARVLVSQWQEEIKNDRSWTWREYVDAAKDPDQATQLPALGFWMRADPVRVCDTWAAVVGAERVHLVTVPPAGAPRGELVERFGSVVGFKPEDVPIEPEWHNEMVGAAGTEVLRRVNEALGGRLNQAQHTRAVRRALVPMLVRETDRTTLTLPADEYPWVAKRAEETISALSARGYSVTGDLADLRPSEPDDLVGLDAASQTELLDAAVQALALLTERYATSWWVRKGKTVEDVAEEGGLASRARGRFYRAKEWAVGKTERSPLAGRLVGRALRAERRRVERARERGDAE
jgi:hypothetical protein